MKENAGFAEIASGNLLFFASLGPCAFALKWRSTSFVSISKNLRPSVVKLRFPDSDIADTMTDFIGIEKVFAPGENKKGRRTNSPA